MKLLTNRLPSLPVTTPLSPESFGPIPDTGNSPLSSNFGTANFAVFAPWAVESPTKIVKAFAINGITATGNIDIGIYDYGFNLLVSHGGTGQTGTNQIQEFDITDTWLMPGDYWMAVSMSSSSGTIYVLTGGDEIFASCLPMLEATSAYPLPSTVTPVKTTKTSPFIPCIGFSTETTI